MPWFKPGVPPRHIDGVGHADGESGGGAEPAEQLVAAALLGAAPCVHAPFSTGACSPLPARYAGQRPIGQSSCGSQAFLSMKQQQSEHWESWRCSHFWHWATRRACSGASTVLKPVAAKRAIAAANPAATCQLPKVA
jgi:hypothetical protein